jgi:hypothetical protein
MFYMPKGTCVVQRGQRIRWINMPEPDAAQLAGKLLLVATPGLMTDPEWRDAFSRVEKVADLTRKRGPLVIEDVELDLLEGPTGEVLDRSPPPELGGR